MKIKQVYIDIDGVLADLILQTERYLHKPPIFYPGNYDLTKMFDISFEHLMHLFDDHAFWANIPVFNWAETLIEFFYAHGIFVYFVTHAVDSENAFSGKYAWFVQHFHAYKSELIFIQGSMPESKSPGCRHLLAREDRLLIDDNDQNVAGWVLNSGPAILFPQMWNANHELKNQPMRYVMDRFAEIENEMS